jgi:hypothetical protein
LFPFSFQALRVSCVLQEFKLPSKFLGYLKATTGALLWFHVMMVSAQEKERVVVWFSEFKSVVRVPREFCRVYQKAAPHAKSIKAWY